MKIYTSLNMPSWAEIKKMKKPYTAVSTFSGMGGASIGLALAGFKVLYSNEFVPIALETYQANKASYTIADGQDIRKVTVKALLKQLKLKPGELDLLEGSPPCKIFSATQARKGLSMVGKEIPYSDGIKQRVDDLFFEWIRLLKGLKPKTFIAENVPGLMRDHNRGIFLEILDAMEATGYNVTAFVMDGSRMGVPQARQRLIFMGIRKDLKLTPKPPKPLDKPVYVRDMLPNVSAIKCGKKFRPAATNFSPTITAADRLIGFTADFSAGAFIELDDGTIRKYNIKELKRISSVPADYKMKGNFLQQFERLGRIHLPLCVYYIAMALREQVLE